MDESERTLQRLRLERDVDLSECSYGYRFLLRVQRTDLIRHGIRNRQTESDYEDLDGATNRILAKRIVVIGTLIASSADFRHFQTF